MPTLGGVFNPAADIDLTGSVTLNSVPAVGTTATQTLTNKTLTAPVLTAAIVTPAVTTITGDGAITIASGVVKLTKGSAAAITLAAPTSGQEGTRITVISNTAFAHVITATGLNDDGVVGGSKNTATFAAFAGAAITLVAIGLKWSVESLKVVTVA